jgi:hypothetical protein
MMEGNFWRGVKWGVLLSIPLWGAIIAFLVWAIGKAAR